MNVLVGFEESQAVCKAFRERGHEAYSNDLQECSGGYPEWHLQMDVFKAIDLKKWDLIGLHPTCTYLTLAGNRHYAEGKAGYNKRLEAVKWTQSLWNYAISKCKSVYMENPLGVLNRMGNFPKPQIVHPYYFGDSFQKTTCLWLKGLPLLIHSDKETLFDKITHVDRGEMVVSKSGRVMPKWFAETPSTKSEANRTIRSKTFPGIAKAMAEQWG